MTDHIPAITRHRTSSGWLEGWDRHAERWVPLGPPAADCSAAVRERYRAVVAVEKAREGPSPVRQPEESRIADRASAYSSGYAAGRKKGRSEAGEATVVFSGDAYAILCRLAERTGRDITDLLGEAVALEERAIEAREAGGRVLIEREGRVVELAEAPVGKGR